ncbi:MAG TPA: hypothetical protein VGL72_09020 [Bryobacteraceae bacterium]|jgi:hypothetical protein
MATLVLVLTLALSAFAAGTLPVTPAETLSGGKLQFPTALAGRPAVCVLGFSKEAGDLTKTWITHLADDGINAWSVANLEKAPAFVRGMIRGSMRKGTPAVRLEHSLILTRDLKAWEQALGSKQESLPVVIILDSGGNVVWNFQGAFDDQPYRDLRAKLEAVR